MGMLIVTVSLLWLFIFPDQALAYVPLVSGGIFFQVFYSAFAAIIIFMVVPLRNIREFIKKIFKI
jgi:hypothetical protein